MMLVTLPKLYLHKFFIAVCLLALGACCPCWVSAQESAPEIDWPEPVLVSVDVVDKDGLDALRQEAEKGDAAAQYQLGYIYYYGVHGPVEERKAWEWFKKAADQGHAPAQYALGTMFRDGRGAVPDRTRAFSFLKKASAQGVGQASYAIAQMYERGRNRREKGPFRDITKAFEMYELAGEQGLSQGYLALAHHYRYGETVEPNKRHAIYYYQKAAKLIEDDAYHRKLAEIIGAFYKEFAAYADNPEEALEWHKRMAKDGDTDAQVLLGNAYLTGHGTEVDRKKAIEWFEQAAEEGNVEAHVKLAEIYSSGVGGVPIDYKKAFDYYLYAAENRHAGAAWNVGNFYMNGFGVQRDKAKADLWFRRSYQLAN